MMNRPATYAVSIAALGLALPLTAFAASAPVNAPQNTAAQPAASEAQDAADASDSSAQTPAGPDMGDTGARGGMRGADGGRMGGGMAEIDADAQAVIDANASKFQQLTFTDPATGIELSYSLYVPADFNGNAGARSMEEHLGIPAFDFGPCYDVDRIEELYGGLARLLEMPAPDCAPWRAQVETRIRETRDLVGDTPVVVDCEASLVPFALARALLAYGFNVTHVFHSHHPFDADAADRTLIAGRYPQVACLPSNDARLHVGDRSGLALPDPSRTVAVGTTGAAIVGTDRAVDVWHNEGLTGFHGVGLLMEKIAHAYCTGGDRG